MLILAAHQGEELVIALPLAMLGAAYFLLKWAASGPSSASEEEDETPEHEPKDRAA